MKLVKFLAVLCALFLATASAFATVSFNIDAELLQNSGGTPMPVSGLVLLVASTTDSLFGTPTPSAFVSSDDIVIGRWDLSAFMIDGVLSDTTGTIALSGNWTAGDPVQIYWYPTLTLSALSPGAGTQYGTYRHPTGLDGSEAWDTPTDGDLHALKFFTADASFLNAGGSNPQAAGSASLRTDSGVADPEGDADGDGMSNLAEQLAGTDPLDRDSVLRITAVEMRGDAVVISFSSVAGKMYRVTWATSPGGSYSHVVADNIPGTGGIVQATHTGVAGEPTRFYRVELVL